MARRLAWAVTAFVIAAATARATTTTVSDPTLGFTMTVPDGYARRPGSGDLVYQFTKNDPADGAVAAVLSVQRLHQTVDAGEHVAPATGGSRTGRPWHGTEVDVYRSHVTRGDAAGDVRLAVLPLAGEGVQVAVLVRDGTSLRADDELNAVLNGFEPTGGVAPAATEPAGGGPAVRRRSGRIAPQVVLAACAWAGLAGLFATSSDRRRRAAVRRGALAGVTAFVLLVVAAFAAYAARWAVLDRFDPADVGKLIVVAPAWVAGCVGLAVAVVLQSAGRTEPRRGEDAKGRRR